MPKMPGGELARRPLHFVWIVDCSGSMNDGGKIQSLNTAVREALPHMRKVAEENPHAEVKMRALKFSSGAQWHVATPTPVETFTWSDLSASGETHMGKAFSMVAEQLKMPPMESRALPPVLVLVSDGQPTDDYSKGLKALMAEPWGKKAVRMAIAIGEDVDTDILQKFIGSPEVKPLLATNPESLVKYVRWVSTVVMKSASAPASQAVAPAGGAAVPIPAAPPATGASVW